MTRSSIIHKEYVMTKVQLIKLCVDGHLPSATLLQFEKSDNRALATLRRNGADKVDKRTQGVKIEPVLKQLVTSIRKMNLIIDSTVISE